MHLISTEETSHTHTETSPLLALGPVFFYFIAAGIATVMIGPLLPALIQHWHLRDAQAGTLFTADFLGQLCGSWFAARNLKASILYGSALTALGCAALVSSSFGPAHIAFFAIGVGLGAGLTAGNVIAGTFHPARRARLLTILNVAWGVGAIACPLLIHLTSLNGVAPFLYLTAAFLLLSTVLAFAIPAAVQRACSPPPSQKPRSSMPLPPSLMLAFIAAMFLYVGVENALGGWLPSYAVRIDPGLHPSSVALLFWIAELAGRLLIVALITVIDEAVLFRLCLALLIAVQAVLCVAVHPGSHGVMLLTVLTAFSLAPVYPLVLSFLLGRTGRHANLGALFASACIGGATLPWLTGVLSTHLHGLRAGLTIPAIGAIVLLLLSPVITATPPAARSFAE